MVEIMDLDAMENLTILPLTDSAELEIIRDLARAIWPVAYGEILAKAQIKYMLNLMYEPAALQKEWQRGVHFLMARVAGKPVGYGAIEKIAPALFKIHKLYLQAEYQHLGIGSSLIAAMKKWAKQQGGVAILLNVNKFNIKAQKFYAAQSFDVLRAEKNPIGQGFFMDDLVMIFNLARFQA